MAAVLWLVPICISREEIESEKGPRERVKHCCIQAANGRRLPKITRIMIDLLFIVCGSETKEGRTCPLVQG
jgi:hypothetical protein